jgi:hypothetical protein
MHEPSELQCFSSTLVLGRRDSDAQDAFGYCVVPDSLLQYLLSLSDLCGLQCTVGEFQAEDVYMYKVMKPLFYFLRKTRI